MVGELIWQAQKSVALSPKTTRLQAQKCSLRGFSLCFFNIISAKCMATLVLRNGQFMKWNGQFRNMHVCHHAQLIQIMMELMDLVQVYAMLL